MAGTHAVRLESSRRMEESDACLPFHVDDKVWATLSECKRKQLTALWNSVQLISRRIATRKVGTEAILPSLFDHY
eukprot:767247-Hanusia_phi.AAC.2